MLLANRPRMLRFVGANNSQGAFWRAHASHSWAGAVCTYIQETARCMGIWLTEMTDTFQHCRLHCFADDSSITVR